jgi:hypothetical protein
MKVIEAVSKGEKPSDVARQFGLNPSTVAGILAKQNKYREAWQKGATDVKAIKVPKFAKLDEALFEWFKICMRYGMRYCPRLFEVPEACSRDMQYTSGRGRIRQASAMQSVQDLDPTP